MGRIKKGPKVSPFAKRLNSLMEQKNMGVREAGRLAGIGHTTITSWRSGAEPYDYHAVKKLANALGTTLSYLLTGEEDLRSNSHLPTIAEVFDDGGPLFDGYAKIIIQRLIPKNQNDKKEK